MVQVLDIRNPAARVVVMSRVLPSRRRNAFRMALTLSLLVAVQRGSRPGMKRLLDYVEPGHEALVVHPRQYYTSLAE